MSLFTSETLALAEERIAQIEALGIECRIQRTYFDDEVCVHNNGPSARASIYSPIQFINWADFFLSPAHQAEQERITTARLDAGWETTACGTWWFKDTHESDWGEACLPFPEDVADYIAWFRNLPGGTDQSPYPDAPPERACRYVTQIG